jgi:hypothetical protein
MITVFSYLIKTVYTTKEVPVSQYFIIIKKAAFLYIRNPQIFHVFSTILGRFIFTNEQL